MSQQNLLNKKILVVCTTDNMIWQFLLPHIARLQELGAAVECACNETGFWYNELASRGLIMHKLPFERSPFKIANIKAYGRLKKLIKANGYDIIYCHQPVGGMLGRMAGKRYGCKVIYVAHGFFFWEGCPAKNKLLYRTAERLLSKRTDALITINEEDYAAAKKMKAKQVFLTGGIGFTRKECAAVDIKRELGIRPGDKTIVTVSELIPRKNYPKMLAAIAGLPEDVKYIICGTGSDEAELKELARRLGIENRVHFLGYRKDVRAILPECDLLLHFARHEGLPVALLEAMDCGLPVLASDIRGCRDLIDERGGILLPLDATPQQIASAAASLLAGETLRQEMGAYNKEKAQKYHIDNVLREFDEIYEKL